MGYIFWLCYVDLLWMWDGCVCVEIVNVVFDVFGVVVDLWVYDN